MAKKEPLGWGDLAASATSAPTPSGKKGWGDITLGYEIPEQVVEPDPELLKPPSRSASEYITDPLAKAASGVIGVGEAAVGAADFVTGGRAGQWMEENLGYRPEETKAFIRDEFFSDKQRADDAKIAAATGFSDTAAAVLENPMSGIGGAIAESLPSMLGGAGVARGILAKGLTGSSKMAAAAAGAIGEGVVAGAAATEDFRQKAEDGRLGGKEYLAASGTAVGTGLFGFVGGKLASKFGFGDIDTMLARGGAEAVGAGQMSAKEFGKQMFKAGISEGVFEEMPQSIQEQMWQNFVAGKPLDTDLGKVAAQGLIVGAAMGMAGGGYNASTMPAEQRARFKDYVIASAVQGGTPTIEEFLKHGNDTEWYGKNAAISGVQQNIARAESVLIDDPDNQEAIKLRDSATATLTAMLASPDARAATANNVSQAAIETIVGAKTSDDALGAFTAWQNASSTLRTGAAAAATVIDNPAAAPATTEEPTPTVAPLPTAGAAPEAQVGGVNAAALATAPTVRVETGLPAAAVPAPTPAPAAAVPAPTPAPNPAAKLPQALAGAKPRYGFGANQFIPTFESDIDKAAFIISQKKPSKRDADYLKFVMESMGVDEAGARAHGAAVRTAIKSIATGATPGQLNVPTVGAAPVTTATPAAAAATPIRHIDRIRDAARRIPVGREVSAVLRLTEDNSNWMAEADDLRELRQMNTVPTLLAGPAAGLTQQEWDEFRADVATRTTGSGVKELGARLSKKKNTVTDMLTAIEKSETTNPHFRKLAAALKRIAKGNEYFKLQYGAIPEAARRPGLGGRVMSLTDTGAIGFIQNNPEIADEQTTLHEATHAATASWLNRAWRQYQNTGVMEPLLAELTEMRNAAVKSWEKQNPGVALPYGLKNHTDGRQNLSEFMAEAFANPTLQNLLMNTPATKDQSLWDKLVGWVRDVIGDPDIDLKMLGQAMAAIEKAAKASTKVSKANVKAADQQGATATDMEFDEDLDPDDQRTRETLEGLANDTFRRMTDEGADGSVLDDFTGLVEQMSRWGYGQLRDFSTSARSAPGRALAAAIADRVEVGYDDAYDIINARLEELEQDDAANWMMGALGLEADDLPDYTPDGFGGMDADEPDAGVGDTVQQHELDMQAALNELLSGDASRRTVAKRTIQSSEGNLNYMATTTVNRNAPQNRLARAMLAYPTVDDARVAAEKHVTEYINGNLAAAGQADRNGLNSDAAPKDVMGARNIPFNFNDRLGVAYRSGALAKLAQFWRDVVSSDDQFKIKVDTDYILPKTKGELTSNDLIELARTYNEAIFKKAKEWAKKNGQPEPDSDMIIRSLRHAKNDSGKPIIRLVIRGRGTGRKGDNPYLSSTMQTGEASMDYNPLSNRNEIHTMDLAPVEGAGDIAYRIFADIANATGKTLPSADMLMTNNNVRRPWQTVAASLRTKNPDVLSPMGAEGQSLYGIDRNLWEHLSVDERIGANILRHAHNMLVSRPSNGEQWGRQVISAGRELDNLVPTKDGTAFVAKYEPSGTKGVSKGVKIDMRDLTRILHNAGAIGKGKRQGIGPTSMAFALMTQHVMEQMESGQTEELTKTAIKMGRKSEGWFFELSDAKQRQLREEIEAVQAVIADENLTAEERAHAREALKTLIADPLDMKINELLDEHRNPQTSNGRRGEINRQIAALRMEQEAKRDTVLTNIGVSEQVVPEDDIVPPVRMEGYHYSHQPRTELSPQKYGTGYKGSERSSVLESPDSRLRNRVHFYADAGNGVRPESGVGGVAHHAYLGGIYPAHEAKTIQKTVPNTLTGDEWNRAFESAVLDAGYAGYSATFGNQLAVVVFGDSPIPVQQTTDVPGQTNSGATPAAGGETLINVGLDVGADERTEKLTPAQVRKEIEKVGGKIVKTKVVPVTYEQDGKTITEDTLVVGLAEPMDASQMSRLAEATKQVAIGQWTEGKGGKLHGAQAWTWGGFNPNYFYGLDGKPVSSRDGNSVVDEETVTDYAPAAQQAITGTMVAPAYPNEVKIVARGAQAVGTRLLERFREKYQDQNTTLGRVIRALGKTGDAVMDVVNAIDRSKGLIQSNLETLVKEPLAKIENDLVRAGVKDHMTKLEEYLKFRHVEEANLHGAKINPFNATTGDGFDLLGRPASGITTATATTELARIAASPDFAALQAAAKTYDGMIHALQDYAVARGLESPDTIRAWRATFKNYAPFYRDLGLEDTFSTGAQGYSTRAGVSRRFMGSSADIRPILPSVRLLGQRIVNRGETARVAQSLLSLAKRNTPMFMAPDGTWKPMWKIDTFPNIRTVKAVNVYQFKDINGNLIRNSAGLPIEFYRRTDADSYLVTNTNQPGGPKVMVEQGVQERVVTTQKPDYASQDNVVIVPMNGQNVAVVFNDQSEDANAMYRNLKNMDTEALSRSMVLPQIASRWIVATATGYNPVFAIFNFARDIQATAANINADKIPGWKTGDTKKVVTEALANVVPLYRHLHTQWRNLHTNAPRLQPPARNTPAWWMEFAKASGGLTGIMDSTRSFDEAQSEINELFGAERAAKRPPIAGRTKEDWGTKLADRAEGVRELFEATLEGEAKGVVSKRIGALAKWVGNLNQAAELATRTAAFKAAYEKFIAAGNTPEKAAAQAAIISKNVSVNFNRRGQNTTFWGALFPFFNAAVQGSARLFETLYDRKTITNPDGSKSDTSEISSFGKKVLAVLPALGLLQAILLAGFDDDEIPEADKDRNFIVPLGSTGKFVKLPLPLGFNVPFNMAREAADMAMAMAGHDGRSFGKHAEAMILQPVSGFNPLGGAGSLSQTISPALLDPIIALSQNEDAFGRKIAKEDMDKTKPTPGYTRYKEGATGFAKGAAKLSNYLSGGGEYGIGAFSPTPDQIDYAVGQLTGGVGREVSKTAQALGAGYDMVAGNPREELPWYRAPVVGRLYGDVNEPANVKSMIYSDREQIARLDYERDQAIKAKDKAAAAAIVAEHPEVNLMPRIDAALREDAQLRKARIKAREAGDTELVNQITDKANQKMLKLRTEIDRIKAK